jgi:hypothetical protein
MLTSLAGATPVVEGYYSQNSNLIKNCYNRRLLPHNGTMIMAKLALVKFIVTYGCQNAKNLFYGLYISCDTFGIKSLAVYRSLLSRASIFVVLHKNVKKALFSSVQALIATPYIYNIKSIFSPSS